MWVDAKPLQAYMSTAIAVRYMRCQALFEGIHLTVVSCALYSDSWFIARSDFTAALVWRCMSSMLVIFAAK